MAKIKKVVSKESMGVTGGMNPHKVRRQSGAVADPLSLGSKIGSFSSKKIPVKKSNKKIKGGY